VAFFTLSPCMPSSWPTCSIEWRFGKTHHMIVVENPERRCRGVASAELDGSPVEPAEIPLEDEGRAYRARVVLGASRDALAGAAQSAATQAGTKTPRAVAINPDEETWL